MKRYVWILLLALYTPCVTSAQSEEVQQLLLDIEKLSHLKQMLKDLKTGYEIVYKGYSTVKNISEGNYNLHQAFLDGLLEVSPAVRNYKKVADIIRLQLRIVSEYKSAFNYFKQAGTFRSNEIDYIGKVYSALFNETLKNIQTLTLVITSGTLRMSDDERLNQIDDLYEDMADKIAFLRHFNNQTAVLALQRTKAENDVNAAKNIHGLTN